MQTTTHYNSLDKSIAIITLLLGVSFSSAVQAEEAPNQLALLDAGNKWQVARLFEPTKNELRLEKQGYIMIYDNLADTTVDQAMDNNFDRIENMMFTRVVVTDEDGLPALDESGNIVKEDDGC